MAFASSLHVETLCVGLLALSLIFRLVGDEGVLSLARVSPWRIIPQRKRQLPFRFFMAETDASGSLSDEQQDGAIATTVREARLGDPTQQPKPSFSGYVRQVADFLHRVVENRLLMAVLTGLALLIYLWNAPAAIDYPVYDEARYFFRGYQLLHGDFAVAALSNINTSPLSVLYYALWYTLLHTSLVYPWVMASSIVLMGMAAYLLLSRMLPPALSLVLALVAVVGSAPIAPGNANYYLGAGVLWISLTLLTRRVWQRGLALLGVLISLYARPEFVVVFVALLVALAVYEWRAWKQERVTPQALAIGYAPVVLAMALSAWLVLSLPGGTDYRSATALPWSYNDFYRVAYPQQFHGNDSYSNPWIIYEKDFGPVKPRSLTNTMVALTHKPGKMGEYVAFDSERLLASFGTAAFATYGWNQAERGTNVVINITAQDTWEFGLGVFVFVALAAASFFWLRRNNLLGHVPVRMDKLTIMGSGALLALLVPLILINPQQRFWMLYPFTLLVVGVGLMVMLTAGMLLIAKQDMTRIARLSVIRPLALAAGLILVLLLIPQPYSQTPEHINAETIDFLQQYVPPGSTIIGEPASSYAEYLAADGYNIQALSPADYLGSRYIGAFESHPSLTYALLTPSYPQSAYRKWFAEWNVIFPQMPWSLVVEQKNPNLALYALPPHGTGYGRISYELWQLQAKQLHLSARMPSFAALDFDQQLTWQSDNPGHHVHPTIRSAWHVPVSSFSMHPYYSGLDAYPTISSAVETTIPASWSGRSLLFFATLAPYAAAKSDAQGVKLTFAFGQSHVSQTVDVLNYAQPHWLPIVVKVPQLASDAMLHVNIQQRVSIFDDTTYFGFIGVTQAAG